MEKYYHGSKFKIDSKYLEPRASRVIDNEKAVFATNNRAFALMFINKWNDSQIQLGSIGGSLYCLEMHPNTFNLLKGSGYIYGLSPSYFSTDKRLGMKKVEFISKKRVTILKVIKIKDALAEIKKSIIMITFDKQEKFIRDYIEKAKK